jgi:hypothetical protein
MSIACGHCGGRHESVREVRECAITDNRTDAEREVDAIVREPDPWEGAEERAPGEWVPGPAYYLAQKMAAEQLRRSGEVWGGDNLPPAQGGFGGPTADEIRQKQIAEELKEITPGFYAMEDDIYQVVASKGTGRVYAKVQDGQRWEYAKGAVMRLKPEMRLTLDKAKEHGHKTGRCAICGAVLTNPDSIEAGIGPICASRF